MTCEKFDKLTLLSFVTGDLRPATRSAVESHLRQCRVCADFIRQVNEERSAFLDELPSIDVVPVKNRKLFRFAPARAALAVAAGLILAVGTGSLMINRTSDGYRTKGNVTLMLIAQDSTGAPGVRKEPVFAPGERIQFTYSCGDERYFILASIDDTGRISVFYPAHTDSSMPVEPGRDLPLPNSILLDDYIGKELFIAVFSARPLQVAAVADEVKRAFSESRDLHKLLLRIDRATIRSILLTKREGLR